MKIRPLQQKDWPTVRRIYQEGMDTDLATFETKVPDWKTWNSKFLEVGRLVVEAENKVLGWAVLSAVSSRYVYRGVAEVSIYVDILSTQKGIGSILMAALIEAAEEEKLWTLQSSIFLENEASIRLHKKFGFRTVGIRERIAQRNGIWRDTVIMERRSKINY